MPSARAAFPASDRRLMGIGAGVALLVGGTYGAQRVLLRVVRDQPPDALTMVATQLVPWLVWVLLLPPLVRLCLRVPLTGQARTIGLYLGAGATASLVHTALAVVPIGLVTRWQVVNRPLWVGFQQLLLNRALVSVSEFALIVVVLHAVLFHARSRRDAEMRQRLERSLADAELRALRMQLEPHFLFNTLNAIGAYVRVEPATAEAMLRHLSAVLRAVLDGGRRATSTVADELALVQAYLAIHQVRMGDRLTVSIEVDPAAGALEVPTLLLQPLVENAIVHGVARRPGAVRVAVDVRCADASLVFTVTDAGAPITPATRGAAVAHQSTGIGLANTRARLEHVYGSAHQLDAVFGDDGTVVTIRLPQQMPEAA